MLTERQNFIETIRHGKPDRFANQFRAIAMVMATPYGGGLLAPGTVDYEDEWGVHWAFPEGTPGQFPLHTPDKIVIKDIENWRDYVKFPKVEFTDEEWAPFVAMANAIDREKYLVAPFVAPGIFEMCHHLQEIQNCLMNFYEYPDEMHELIDALTEWELKKAEQLCKYIKPDALFHHDDWGSHNSTFISPAMWREFIKPASTSTPWLRCSALPRTASRPTSRLFPLFVRSIPASISLPRFPTFPSTCPSAR